MENQRELKLEKVKALNLSKLLEDFKYSNDNLHRIAISNVADGERSLQRWWQKKYKTAIKHFNDYVQEELVIEMLEDFYDNNRSEIDRFYSSLEQEDYNRELEWNGELSPELEAEIQERYSKREKVDLSAFQSEKDRELTIEEENKIFESLGRNLPNSVKVKDAGVAYLGSDEFDEEFGA